MKGDPVLNRNVDCDVIVSEVRETSRKPDELYDLIERLKPGGRKIELFARPHNRRRNWLSLGDQLPGVRLREEELVRRWRERYPEIDCNQEEEEKN